MLPVICRYSDRTMVMQRIILIQQTCLKCTSYILECRNNYDMIYFETIIKIHSELLTLSISFLLKKKSYSFWFFFLIRCCPRNNNWGKRIVQWPGASTVWLYFLSLPCGTQ